MTSNTEYKSYTAVDHTRLFKSFAESLKLPLSQIARSAELSRLQDDTASLAYLESAADTLNRLIDTYLLSLNIHEGGVAPQLVPVSVGAVLHEVAHILQGAAQDRSFDLELSIPGRYAPILAEPVSLKAALVSLGQVLMDARSQRPLKKRPVITLVAHRARGGIVAGAFTNMPSINTGGLRRGYRLCGLAGQPLNQLTSDGGAGVFIASSLLSTMSGGLRAARYHGLNGLAATFAPSQQLALV